MNAIFLDFEPRFQSIDIAFINHFYAIGNVIWLIKGVFNYTTLLFPTVLIDFQKNIRLWNVKISSKIKFSIQWFTVS